MDEQEFVRDLPKKVYGENYDHSQYEHMLKFYHDFGNFLDDLYSYSLDFYERLYINSLNKLDKFVKNLSITLDNYKKKSE